MIQNRFFHTPYTPTYFLAALGNGGLTISFFVYLQFMIPHPETPVVTFDAIVRHLSTNNIIISALIVAALIGMIVFLYRHISLLIKNLIEISQFYNSEAHNALRDSNKETLLAAVPLTLAMSVNVLFATGAVFVPGLWSIIEYLFPFAILSFGAIGLYALYIYFGFLSRVLVGGHFDCSHNNSLSQMLVTFAFAMIAVGFAAPAAMSQVKTTIAIGAFLSLFFLTIVLVFGAIQLVHGFRSMLDQGIDKESSVSLWIIVPIFTLIGIAMLRLSHGFHHVFHMSGNPAGNFVYMSMFVALQLVFALLGYMVMKRIGYFSSYLSGAEKSPGSYSLICPGVAGFVFGMFFLHVGLVKSGIIDKFSLSYFTFLTLLVVIQFLTIVTIFRLDRKLLSGGAASSASTIPIS